MSVLNKSTSDAFDTIPESDEISKLQTQNESLSMEIVKQQNTLKTLTIENTTLKEENEVLLSKVKRYENLIDKESVAEGSLEQLKAELAEKESEIEKLNEFIREELINSENMQNEYENEIQGFKQEISAMNEENEQIKIEINTTKQNCNSELERCFLEMSVMREEKEQIEQSLNKEIEVLHNTIKVQQNKIYELDLSYKSLSERSAAELKETIDKYTNDIKQLQHTSDSVLQSLSSKNEIEIINNINKQLKGENIRLKADLEKIKNDLKNIEAESNETNEKNKRFEEIISEYKHKNSEQEKVIDKLKSEFLNANFNIESDSKEKNEEKKNNERYSLTSKEFEKLKDEKEELLHEVEKYKSFNALIKATDQLTYRVKAENKKLKEMLKKNQNDKSTQQNTLCGFRSSSNFNNIKSLTSSYDASSNSSSTLALRMTTKPNERKQLKLNEMANGNSFPITKDPSSTKHSNQENKKQTQLLSEQNKLLQKDIEVLSKAKSDLLEQIKSIQKEKCSIEEKLISKEREIMKYRTICNRLKLRIKELTPNI